MITPQPNRFRLLLQLLGTMLFLFIAVSFPITTGKGTAAPLPEKPKAEVAQFVQLAITQVNPTIVRATGGDTVTIAGTATNFSDRAVRGLVIRLQRGTRLNSSPQLRTALGLNSNEFQPVTPFISLHDELKPAESIPFKFVLPISGPANPSLGIDEPGVYPLLVNLNGTPDFGVAMKLDDSRFLLPVESLPPNTFRAQMLAAVGTPNAGLPFTSRAVVATDGSVRLPTSTPAEFSMIWPIAAITHRISGVPGDQSLLLANEELSDALSGEGRLNRLLNGLAHINPNSIVNQAICLAIDPNLVQTVKQMSTGYRVLENPANPQGPTKTGIGKQNAGKWLAQLRQILSRTCGFALPFAQADLDSLAKIADSALTESALNSTAVDRLLGNKLLNGITLSPSGILTKNSQDLLAANKNYLTIISANTLSISQPSAYDHFRLSTSSGVFVYDPAIHASLGALGAGGPTSGVVPPNWAIDVSNETAVSRRQSAVAALAFPAISLSTTSDSPLAGKFPISRGSLIVPPLQWAPEKTDLTTLIESISSLATAKLIRISPLKTRIIQALADINKLPSATTTFAETSLAQTQLTTHQIDTIQKAAKIVNGLAGSLVSSNRAAFSPTEYISPLRGDLLRSIRFDPTRRSESTNFGTQISAQIVSRVIDETKFLGSQVKILNPGGRYTLASERSPLLLVIKNDLPLPIKVRLRITVPEGMKISDVDVVEIPAQGTRQLQLATRADASTTMRVKFTLETSTHQILGNPISLDVRSNAYGKPLFYVTVIAGVLLILLVSRRIYHRLAGQPDTADADRPEPDQETLRRARRAGTENRHS